MKTVYALDDLKHVHVIGVCGTLMGAFAAFLKRRGIRVTGSDQNVYPPMSDVLKQAGVELFSGYKPENLAQFTVRPDLVVIGNVISRTNPEAALALDGGYSFTSLPEAMERLMLRDTHNCVVAGTHGKTTTASILAFVMIQSGLDPNYFIGGVSPDLPFSFQVVDTAAGRPFVLEGDEYDTAFWDKVPKFNHYLPDSVILTSIEYDHADIYADMSAVVRAFEGLVTRIRPGGRLIACWDFEHVRKVCALAQVPVLRYASRAGVPGAEVWPERIESDGEFTRFEVVERGRAMERVSIRLPGLHNVANALAVYLLMREMGVPVGSIVPALAQFHGVKRRQEVRGEVRGVLVVDDFAHHPTAVRETLRALKMRYPDRRLVTVFEPRSATSRRKVFQKDYADAFALADQIFIAQPYDQSKIQSDDQFSSQQLVADIQGSGKDAHLFEAVQQGVTDVARLAQSGDCVAVLSNGGFEGFIPKLLAELNRQ